MGMSYQIEVLKVLASYPDGCATVEAIKGDLAALASREWSERIRALAESAGKVNVFSSRYIVRSADHWQITEAGLQFLTRLEAGTLSDASIRQPEPDLIEEFTAAFTGRPQRPFSQHRPDMNSERRSIMRRVRKLAGNWVGYKSG
jgi:hypothetical protein